MQVVGGIVGAALLSGVLPGHGMWGAWRGEKRLDRNEVKKKSEREKVRVKHEHIVTISIVEGTLGTTTLSNGTSRFQGYIFGMFSSSSFLLLFLLSLFWEGKRRRGEE